jgi:catechol 2,3-dioxygenase-like lactoylglutathione lyase family enzyme
MKIAAVGVLCGVFVAALPAGGAAQVREPDTVAPLLWQPSMNVFRRFVVDRAKMLEFYGDVLGLAPMSPMLGGQMSRFLVGTSEIKLTSAQRDQEIRSKDVHAVAGLRVLTFFFPDEAALVARFQEHGYPLPEFRAVAGGRRAALVRDPDGQWVELVAVRDAPADLFDRIEVGITARDLERSRAFYREFVGLDELPPVHDPLLGVTRYPFRHGTTTVNVWAFGGDLPVDTHSGGIQYVVHDVDGVDARAKAKNVTIDQPLTPRGEGTAGIQGLRTVWLADPDGVTNYFAETPQSRASRDR